MSYPFPAESLYIRGFRPSKRTSVFIRYGLYVSSTLTIVLLPHYLNSFFLLIHANYSVSRSMRCFAISMTAVTAFAGDSIRIPPSN